MPSTWTFDIGLQEFEQRVLEASKEQIIVVDFWAPWCSPCRTLGPILENVVEEYGGSVLLAKVNVDENPELSQHFQIQGIPAVKIIKDGTIVDEFTGSLPEHQIKSILNKHVPNEADDLIAAAKLDLQNEIIPSAKQKLEQALQLDPSKSEAKLELAKIAIQEKDFENAHTLAKEIEINQPHYEAAQGLLNRLEFLQGVDADKDELINKLEEDENDLDTRFKLANLYAAEEEYQSALEEFLTILKKNKNYNNGAAKDAMVKLFSIIGQRSKLADEYRDKLEWILY